MSRSASSRRKTDCGGEGDVGIDPEQMGEMLLGEKLHHDLVAPARDQAFAVQVQDAGQAEMGGIERHTEDAGDVVHRHRRDVAGRGEQNVHRFEGVDGQHGRSLVAPRLWRGTDGNRSRSGKVRQLRRNAFDIIPELRWQRTKLVG